MAKYIISAFALFLAACGGQQSPAAPTAAVITAGPQTLPSIVKSRDHYARGSEGNPFVWNGQLLYMSCQHGPGHIWIADFQSGQVLHEFDTDLAFPSLFVHQGVAYLFGERPDGNFWMIQSSDLATWSAPALVWDAPSGHYDLNPSIVEDAQGFTMVYEEWITGDIAHSGYVRFAHSTDLLHWQQTPGGFDNDGYAGGPTLKYVNGLYYLFYLVRPGNLNFPDDADPFYVQVARSADLQTWEVNQKAFVPFSPTGTSDEGMNNSDAEMVEFNGATYFVYYVGDQVTWTYLKTAIYPSSLAQYVGEFF